MIRRPRPASLSALPSLVAVALMGLAALGLAAPHEGHAQTPGKGMVSAAHPLASEAGARILRSGGDAIDAAIAVQAVLTLVEPQSSGIGGGAFLLYWDAEESALYTYDGRETAPQSVTPELFLKADGSVLKGDEARVGGRFVGVPGVIAMLGEAHAAHGDLVWSALFQPAIGLAERGFEVTPRLNQMIRNRNSLRLLPNSFAYFYDGAGAPLPVGTVRANPAYAETLLRIAAGGPDEFYGETIGIQIVEAVQGSAIRPGGLTLEDLKTYNAKLRPNLCAPYRTYTVCSMGPPSSGGLTVLQILKLIERFDMGSFAPNSAEALHLIIEASKLAFADRNTFIADPDFVEVPVEGLLDTDYLAARSALIDPDVAARPADPGAPPLGRPDLDEGERAGEGDDEGQGEGQGEAPPTENTPGTGDKPVREGRIPAHLLGVDRSEDVPSTSHFTIVDGAGNIVTMTTTIEA
ncbi:MAG: gamma-glutamyltransferase, partial [Pseudomonadota bacterium]